MTSHIVTYAYCQAFNDLLDNVKVIQYLFEKAVRGDRQRDMTKGKNFYFKFFLYILACISLDLSKIYISVWIVVIAD